MTPSTIDRPELEDRVRVALQARARSTVVEVPEGFTPGLFVHTLAPARRSRRNLLVAAAALAVVILGVAVLLVRDDGEIDSSTEETPDGTAPGIPVHGPTGSPWLLLDLPGLTPGGSSRDSVPAAPGGRPEMQAFRTDAGFDGPTVWVESDAAATGGAGAIEVTVQGEPAFAREDGDVVSLGTPSGDGFYLTAAHMSVDDLVAFANGLQPRDGGGWDATVLPGGLTEVTEDEPPRPAAEHVEWGYTDSDGTNYEFFVDPGGAATFESWAREHVASGSEVVQLSVDGRPGVLVDTGGELVAVWRPTDDVVVDFRTSLDRDGMLAAMEALRPVSEASWVEVFDQPPGG